MRASFDEPVEMVAVMPQEETKKCPFCAERILAEAIKCRHCGEFLNGRPSPSTPKSRGRWYHSTVTIVLAFLTLGPLAIPLVWTNPRYSLIVKTIVTVGMIVITILLCYAMVGMTSRFLIKPIQEMGF